MSNLAWFVRVLPISLLLFAGCANIHPPSGSSEQPPVIGPYDAFSARLIVMEPKHRWQVLLRWSGSRQQGQARLTHAASGRVLKIRWQEEFIALLDNQQQPPGWRGVKAHDLAKRGLVIPPAYLADIFHNRIPKQFHYIGKGRWDGTGRWKGIRMQWKAKRQSLSITDIAHGRQARFIINQK